MQTQTAPPRRWLSQAEAAEYIGVAERTIRHYVAQGRLRAYRIDGSRLIRIDLNELDALLGPVTPDTSAGGEHGG